MENLTLLEEPQAAFYCWLATHPQKGSRSAQAGRSLLVVDVGGGTTDFSLIQATEEQGELTFVRQAVGDHLLLAATTWTWPGEVRRNQAAAAAVSTPLSMLLTRPAASERDS